MANAVQEAGYLDSPGTAKTFVHDISASGSKAQPGSGGDENTLSSQLPVISLPKGGAAARSGVRDALMLPAARSAPIRVSKRRETHIDGGHT